MAKDLKKKQMVKEKDKEELQKKYLELQIIANQINQIQQQINLMQNQILELKNLKENILNFNNIKVGSASYSPIGSNIFVKSKIKDNKEFLVSVGSNVLVAKSMDETKVLIEKQADEIEKISYELENQLGIMDLRFQELQKEIMELDKQ